MIGRVFRFLVLMAVNGFLAIFVTVLFYVVFIIAAAFAMIPVSIILGNEVANACMNILGGNLAFTVVYAIVFIRMMMASLGVSSIKTFIKKDENSRP